MKTPTVAMMCGLPGSGKSRLAEKLEAELPAVRFDLDSWAISLLGQAPPPERLDDLLHRLKDLHYLDPQVETLQKRLADRNRNRPPGTYEITPEMLELFFMDRFEAPEPDEGIEMVVSRL